MIADPADFLRAVIADNLQFYFDKGADPGDFMRAVLANDLFEAVCLADPDSLRALPQITRLVQRLPPICRGSAARVKDWMWAKQTSQGSGQ